MKLEKTENYKRIIIGGLIAVVVITTLILTTSKAKYKNVQSIDLASGTINYTPADIDLVAIQIENDNGEYLASNAVPISGYALSNKSYCNVNGEKDTDINIVYQNGKIGINNVAKKAKYYLYFDQGIKTAIGIIKDNGEKISFTGIADSSDTGIYKAPDDYGTSYYYRGLEGSLNNWVRFAGFYWRIIRINGNGTVRMIYSGIDNGNITNANRIGISTQINEAEYKYNLTYSDNTYVGYMTGDAGAINYVNAHQNKANSNVKTIIDNWYATNVENNGEYKKYIDINTGFCNDREIADGHSNYTEGGYKIGRTVYKPADRVMIANLSSWKTTQNPTLQCANKERDLFTVTSANEGNKKLTYPVGLISSDEVVFAGGFGGTNNSTFYLYTNRIYWTMSPSHTMDAHVFVMNSNGGLDNYWLVHNGFGLRPVINLKADTKFSGSGSESDPYIVI